MEGMTRNPAARQLLLIGLAVMAGGGLFYAISQVHAEWGVYAVGAGLALVLAAALAGRRELGRLLTSRQARLGLGSGASIVAALALVVFLGTLAARHNSQWDLSQGGQFTLAEQTLKVLADLKEPVKAYAFFRNDQAGRPQAKELLDRYVYAGKRFSYQFVDPEREPGLARRFQVKDYGTVVLTSGQREDRIKLPDEESLTNALIRLSRQGGKSIYFLTGHGELSLDDMGKGGLTELKKALTGQGFQVKSLFLAGSSRVPPDAAAVVAAGPKKPFLEPEKAHLAAYLQQGGGLAIFLDPDNDAGLIDWLAQRGIMVGQGLVIDAASQLKNLSPAAPVSMDYGSHDITDPMGGLFTFFPLARPVSVAKNLPAGAAGEDLVRTSQDSWNILDMERLNSTEFTLDAERDKRGPFSLAAVVSLPAAKPGEGAKPAAQAAGQAADQGKAELVVFGDSDFINNSLLGLAGNRDLCLNALGFLAKEKDLIAIRAKKQASQPLLLQPYQAQMVFWLPVVVLPGLLLIIGVVVFIRRRRPA